MPLYILLIIASSFNNKTTNYFNRNLSSNDIIGNASNYEDLLVKEKDFIEDVVIPSKVISENHLKVFVLLNDDIDDMIFNNKPSLKPKNDIRGISSDIIIVDELSRKNRDSIRHVYMNTFNDVLNVKIDTLSTIVNSLLPKVKRNKKALKLTWV